MTIHEFFQQSVGRFGAHPALASKDNKNWAFLNFSQYYQACRRAARAFVKISQSKLRTLKAIVQYKPPIKETNNNIYSWEDFMELGDSIPDSQLERIIESQKANQCAVLIYTSGTMGDPKGVMLSHDNITWMAGAAAKDAGMINMQGRRETVVSYLPLSHIAAQMMDIWIPIKIGGLTYFAQPDALKALVFSKVKKVLGLDHCHYFISGAAPLAEDTTQFFLSLDIPIGQMYGMSESSGPHTISNANMYRILSCGKVLNGCKILLIHQDKDGIGEVCLWGRNIFMGYLEREDMTMEAIDEEGWLHSGDLGRMDNLGFLYITGRIKELIITAGGENVPPIPIETLVKEKIPIISNAILVGDKAKFLSMLLTLKCEIDQMNGEPLDKLTLETIKFCRGLGSQASTVTEIVRLRDPLVYAAIQQGIDAVNQEATSNAQKIRKWAILEKDFSIQGGELGKRARELWP
ncbi:Long-chain-fatty-acid--CoA ligase ACSBG2 [Tupaia chinensis]|uniref:long-chain-fatty-acid--CoA ligase n=1 Tax=Tupaia chinensis TaxID=246437 RepID=L8Y4Y7_TUPCH|nr:Long-chain-fatty-acid--CoA ligase ACSBG2 [Tupaia chinensis]